MHRGIRASKQSAEVTWMRPFFFHHHLLVFFFHPLPIKPTRARSLAKEASTMEALPNEGSKHPKPKTEAALIRLDLPMDVLPASVSHGPWSASLAVEPIARGAVEGRDACCRPSPNGPVEPAIGTHTIVGGLAWLPALRRHRPGGHALGALGGVLRFPTGNGGLSPEAVQKDDGKKASSGNAIELVR